MGATTDQELAELRRACAELRNALAQRNSEYGERLKHQSATIDVLKAMSASPGDPQPVFDLIVERARDLCDAYGATVFEFDGTEIHWRAATGVSDDPAVRAAYEAQFPMVPTRRWAFGRAILDRRVIRIDDMEAEPGLDPTLRGITAKSNVTTPIMRGDEVIGAIGMGSRDKGGFSDSQIELLKTFAEQAAIAITSAETYRALQTRTADLQEALEHQTATSDVLKVISRSTFELQPVLDTLVDTAARLTDADQALIASREGGVYRAISILAVSPAQEVFLRSYTYTPDSGSVVGRVALSRELVQVPDLAADPEYGMQENVRLGGTRTVLGVPLLRDGEPIGVLNVARQRVEPFTDKQIKLVRTFADQAVIAIENARLLAEQREALEQQTATAEVLQVINASPGNLAPVFNAMLDKAVELCGAAFGILLTYDGERFHHVAFRSIPAPYVEFMREHPPNYGPENAPGRLALGERLVHVLDITDSDAYRSGDPNRRAIADLAGARTLVAVPLRKDSKLIGAIVVFRQEVRAFSDKQIALLENFAEQGVIAMENARLLTETREALEQQTATAEVLQVINSSPGDLALVFDTMLAKASRLCGAASGVFTSYDGEAFHTIALRGLPPALVEFYREPLRPIPGSYTDQIARGATILRADDLAADQIYQSGPGVRAVVDFGGGRSFVGVALRKGDKLLGAFWMYRQEVRPFSDAEVALLQNFGAQAVIAMENARLITETREALEQQTATAEVLQVINSSPGDLTPVFDAMLEKAMRLCAAAFGEFHSFVGDRFVPVSLLGLPAAYAEFRRRTPPVYGPGTLAWRVREGTDVLHIADLMDEEVYRQGDPQRRAMVDLGGARSGLSVALRKDGLLLGMINIYRQEVRPFSDRQIALVRGFAAQAVIAMENARLINETREALEQQTATAEVLQVINTNPGKLTPVFNSMLEKAMQLCHANFGAIGTFDGERFKPVALHGIPAAYADYLMRNPSSPDIGTIVGRIARGESIFHIEDLKAEAAYRDGHPGRRAIVELGGARTSLSVALRKDDAILGHITVYRNEVRSFSEREIALLENFAAQAVIAMENARLLTEQREALDQQIATTEVLQIINASPGDLKPVFDAVLAKALQLCAASFGTLLTFDGERLERVALRGVPPAFAEWSRQNPLTKDAALILRGLETGKPVQATDVLTDPFLVNTPSVRDALVNFGGVRALLQVPLLKDGAVHGFIALFRREPGGFPEKQVTLLEGFAAQAVIAMENARLLTELRQRTDELAKRNNEYGERIEQQSATIDVLKAMSASSGDAQPVFQAIVERARVFCNADNANLALVDGDMLHLQATTIGSSATAMAAAERADYMARFPRPVDATSLFGRAVLTRTAVQTPDVRSDPQHFTSLNTGKTTVRALVAVPLLRAGAAMGAIVLARNTPGEFSATQVELLQTFAEQAVIAMSSSETFKELQHRSADLTRSVAELQALEEVLRAVNSSLELETVLSTIISRAVQLSDADEGTIYEFDDAEQVFVPKSAYGMTGERLAALRDRRIRIGETPLGNSAAVRTPVHIPDLTQTLDIDGARGLAEDGIHALLAVPLLRDEKVLGGLVIRRREVGGFAPSVQTLLQTFAGQSVLAIENARLFQEARQARVQAEIALSDLRRAQDQLVQSEKMASLGQLTAGIAHEIKNPLNFVNNFASLSVDLLDELKQTAAPGLATLDEASRAEVDELTITLASNLDKINEHGKRADGIVRGMLEHSRGSSGERREVELNALVDEALNLAYHGARAQDQSFAMTLHRDFGEGIAPITLAPQDVTRVLLNLFSNGFYAARERQRTEATAGFDPTLKVSTRDLDGAVEIWVRDNGIGIPSEIKDRLFQPFFTTKPPGEGTGLGLSMSYDIITQQHGGSISVDSKVGEYSEFTVRLPRRS